MNDAERTRLLDLVLSLMNSPFSQERVAHLIVNEVIASAARLRGKEDAEDRRRAGRERTRRWRDGNRGDVTLASPVTSPVTSQKRHKSVTAGSPLDPPPDPIPPGSVPFSLSSDPYSAIRKVSNGRKSRGEKAPGLFGKILGQFCEIWRERYGIQYEPMPADRNQLGRMLNGMSPELVDELPKAFRAYLGDASDFVAHEMRHNLRHFCVTGGVNKYRANAPLMNGLAARNHAAGAAFLARMTGRGKTP